MLANIVTLKVLTCHFVFVEMLERLIVDPQLKLVSVLHNTQTVLSDREREQESSLV